MQRVPRAFAISLFCLVTSLRGAVIDIPMVVGETNLPTPISSLASDGTSAAAAVLTSNNTFSIQLLSTNAALIGTNVFVASNAHAPLIAYGNGAYFGAWLDDAGVIRGQKLDSSGAPAGVVLQVSDANEVVAWPGSVVPCGRGFAVAWESATLSNSLVRTAIIDAGTNVDTRFTLTASNVSSRFPTLSFDGTNILAAWWEQQTNGEWSVVGKFMDAFGSAVSTKLTISETNAFAARKITSAFGGTNHLVVWSREIGPIAYPVHSGYPPQFTNVYYECLFGRVVSAIAQLPAHEFQITRQVWAQRNPALGFDGTDFVLAWRDLRYSNLTNGPDTNIFGLAEIPTLWARLIDKSGTLKRNEVKSAGYMVGNIALACGNRFSVLSRDQTQSPYFQETGSGSYLYVFKRPFVEEPSLNLISVRAGEVSGFVSFDPQSATVTLEASTNLLNWRRWTNGLDIFSLGGYLSGTDRVRGTNRWPAGSGSSRYYRVHDSKLACIEQLRLIEWAKFQVVFNRVGTRVTEWPNVTDIFGQTGILPNMLYCPQGGAYTLSVYATRPSCSVAGHTL